MIELILSAAALSSAQAEPDPRVLLDQMSAAHGGREAFLNAPAIEFEFVMLLISLPPGDGRVYSDSWRHYVTTVDPDTSRAYVDIVHERKEGFEAGFDGQTLWRGDYDFDPAYQDPPPLLAWYHYGMAAMPFLWDTPSVSLSYEGENEIPTDDKSYHVVKLTYDNQAWNGELDYYIDKETHRLKAWRQGAWAPELPGAPALPTPPAAVLRVTEEYFEENGLVFPRSYLSVNGAGDVGGAHRILDARILDSFEAENAMPPAGAQISWTADAQE